MCTVFLPPGDNPIAVNKYIIPYHIIKAVTSPLIATLIRNITVSGYEMIRHNRARRYSGNKESGLTSPDLSTKFTSVFRGIPQYLQASMATLS